MNQELDYSGYPDNQLLADRDLILDNLEQIHQAIAFSVNPIPDDEAERYEGLHAELLAIELELERRGYCFDQDADEWEEYLFP